MGAKRHDQDKFRVFLVRENRNTDGDNNSNYNCEIHLIQDYDSRVLNGNYNDYVFSDVFSNFLRGDVNKRGSVSIKVHFGSNIYGALNFANGDELVAMTPKKDRIYDVTITVYPTDDFTGDPLYHLNEKILK